MLAMLTMDQVRAGIILDRHCINRECIKLYYEKDAAINENRELSWDYDRKLLILIRKILIHAMDNWQWETDDSVEEVLIT